MLRLEADSVVFEIERRSAGRVSVRARTHWLTARFEETLDEDEATGLAERLSALAEAGAGVAELRPLAGWAELTFVMAKRERLHVSVRLQSAPDYLNEVRLFLDVPQEDLPAIVDALRALG